MKKTILLLIALFYFVVPSLVIADDTTWFLETKKEAETGDIAYRFQAQAALGFYYDRINDYKEGLKWHIKAAENGDRDAQVYLATLYESGAPNLLQDYGEALKWYQKAAEQGDSWSMGHLGFMYGDSEYKNVVRKDLVKSYMWLNLCTCYSKPYAPSQYIKTAPSFESKMKKMDEDSKNELDRCLLNVSKQMTPDQVAKALRLAKEMKKKIDANVTKNEKIQSEWYEKYKKTNTIE